MFDEIKELLRSVKEYVGDDGALLKARIEEDVISGNKNIIKLFLNNEKAKEAFFESIEGSLVFKWRVCLDFLNMNEFLPDSYTKYKNKIGLTNRRGEYLSNNKDVVLSFPYKDCFLQGGQRKDDDVRDEIFYNEVIAKDDIAKMLDAKVFCNVKRYTKEGSSSDVKYKKDDNLIIKGNNLIALYSILRRFEKKIKCIYIDPPYNTGGDSFLYNDSFNHSTWLIFMKNRLEVAKRLLRDDGVIFVQCDDNEQAYLKVLMDEVMGRESFVTSLIWQKKKGGAQDSKDFAKEHEYILCYKKEGWHIYDEREEYQESEFSDVINGRKAKLLKLEKWGAGSLRSDAPSLYYPIKDPNGCDFYPIAPNGEEGRWRKKPESLDDAHIFWKLNSKKRLTPYEVIYYDELDFKVVKTRTILTDYGTTTDATKEIQSLFNEKVFSTTKPEKLIHKILSVSTREGDIVLDFFMGSATTCAVAHKMGRQYIGIEQMDYIKTISVSRLIKVLEGEAGGISKAVNWGGGGAFIYCELKEDRQDLEGYINYSDIDDESVSLSECDREFNRSFYDERD